MEKYVFELTKKEVDNLFNSGKASFSSIVFQYEKNDDSVKLVASGVGEDGTIPLKQNAIFLTPIGKNIVK